MAVRSYSWVWKPMTRICSTSIGSFEAEIEIDLQNSQRVNELLMGVEVLLEVIRLRATEIAC